jgi:hypothetical protein
MTVRELLDDLRACSASDEDEVIVEQVQYPWHSTLPRLDKPAPDNAVRHVIKRTNRVVLEVRRT